MNAEEREQAKADVLALLFELYEERPRAVMDALVLAEALHLSRSDAYAVLDLLADDGLVEKMGRRGFFITTRGVERMDRAKVSERDRHRFLVLRFIHDATGGDLDSGVDYASLPKATGLDADTVAAAVSYLQQAGLVRIPWLGDVALTFEGLAAIEESLRQPERPTEYFPPAASIVVSGSGNVVQVAGHHSTQSQVVTKGVDLAALTRFLDDLDKVELPPSIDDEVRTIERMLRSQITSTQPSPDRIRGLVSTIVATLKDAAATVTAVNTLLGAHGAALAALGVVL